MKAAKGHMLTVTVGGSRTAMLVTEIATEGTAQRVDMPDVSLTRGCHTARADPRGSFSTEMAEPTALNMGLLLQPQHLQKQHQSNPLHLLLVISVCLRFSGLGFFSVRLFLGLV